MSDRYFLPVPSPVLEITLLDEAIAGTVIHLQGTAQLDPVIVDTVVSVIGSWTRLHHNMSEFTDTTVTASHPIHTIILTFNPLRIKSKDGGDYMYSVDVIPENSTFIRGVMANTTYTLTSQFYPNLTVDKSISSGNCIDKETTLCGSVALLNNTASNHTLEYRWSGAEDVADSTSNTVTVGSDGVYMLDVCLNIPVSGIMDHCSTASYTISDASESQVPSPLSSSYNTCNAGPGRVSITCPSNSNGSSLTINWTPPSNSDTVNDYLVVIQRYSHAEGTRDIQLSPSDSYVVEPSDNPALVVSSGIGEYHWL